MPLLLNLLKAWQFQMKMHFNDTISWVYVGSQNLIGFRFLGPQQEETSQSHLAYGLFLTGTRNK